MSSQSSPIVICFNIALQDFGCLIEPSQDEGIWLAVSADMLKRGIHDFRKCYRLGNDPQFAFVIVPIPGWYFANNKQAGFLG